MGRQERVSERGTMSRKTVLMATTAGALVLAGAGAASAASGSVYNGKDQALRAAAAPIALGQAISAAENATGAKALQAAFERQGTQDVVKVTLVKGDRVVASTVDATTGKVIGTKPAAREQGDVNEKEGNEPGEAED